MGTQRVFSLTDKAHFQALLQGNVMGRTPHFVLHARRLCLPVVEGKTDSGAPGHALPVYIGMVIPKRWARRAITRNTIKRQIRAVMAQFAPNWEGVVLVVRLRAMFPASEFVSATSRQLRQAVRAELLQLFAAWCPHRLAMWPAYSLGAVGGQSWQVQQPLFASGVQLAVPHSSGAYPHVQEER